MSRVYFPELDLSKETIDSQMEKVMEEFNELISLDALAIQLNRSVDTLRWLRSQGVFETVSVKVGDKRGRASAFVDPENVHKVRDFIREHGRKQTQRSETAVHRQPPERAKTEKHICPVCGKPNEYPVPGLCKKCYSARVTAKERRGALLAALGGC